MSNKIKYTKGQLDALSSLSFYYLAKEEYVKTLELYFKIIDINETNHDIENLVISYSRVTRFFLLIKDYDLAQKYLGMMTRVAQKTKDPTTHGQVFFNHAMCSMAKEEYDVAISNFYLCIPYFQKAHNLNSEGALYKSLGDAFVQKQMYSQAEYNYRMAIAIHSQISEHAEIAVLYTRIAHIYQVRNNIKLSLKYNLLALRIREKIGNPFFISSSCLNVGEAYWFLNKKDSCSFYLQK